MFFVWHFSFVAGVFGQASFFPYIPHYCGNGNRPALAFDEDLYTGASRALRLNSHRSLCTVHRSGAPEKVSWGLEILIEQLIIDTITCFPVQIVLYRLRDDSARRAITLCEAPVVLKSA